jgi:hypothetical protein
MSDTTIGKAASAKSGLFSAATMQKAVAFAVLIALRTSPRAPTW